MLLTTSQKVCIFSFVLQECGECSSGGQSTRLWPWGSGVQVPSLTPFSMGLSLPPRDHAEETEDLYDRLTMTVEQMVPSRDKGISDRHGLREELDILNRRVRELEALNKVAGLISSTMEVENVLRIIVEEAISLTDSSLGSISIINPEAPNGMTTFVRCEEPELRGITSTVDENLTGWVLENEKPLIVEDLSRDTRFPGLCRKSYGIRSVLSMPLISKGTIVGAINLCNKKKGTTFNEDDVRLVSILSSQSAQVIEGARLFEKVSRENILLKKEVGERSKYKNIVGQSPAMQPVFSLLEHVVASEASVVLQGESGTGKEMIAQAIHRNSSRREGAFVPVECGAIPENLLESELFGYVKGAFTGAVKDKIGLFQQASGGTLFLDEISNMDLNLQAKLLRAIQERKIRPVGATLAKTIDVRIISASRSDLKDLVTQGSFREDLYYRLNVVTVNIPPLRQRKEDISLLANHFLTKFQGSTGTKLRKFSSEAMRLMELYDWPGNVRELMNVVERAVTLASPDDEKVQCRHLPDDILQGQGSVPVQTEDQTLKDTLREVKRKAIVDALVKCGNIKTKAAEDLGISRQGLIKMMKELNLS